VRRLAMLGTGLCLSSQQSMVILKRRGKELFET
jgi:hypothetical protein